MVVNAIKREFEKCDSLKLVSPSTSTPSTAMEAAATPDPVTAALAAMTREELQEVMESEVAMEKLLLSITFPPLDSITENIKSMKEVTGCLNQHCWCLDVLKCSCSCSRSCSCL